MRRSAWLLLGLLACAPAAVPPASGPTPRGPAATAASSTPTALPAVPAEPPPPSATPAPGASVAEARSGEPACPSGMVRIPGGTFRIGSDSGYPREKGGGQMTVASFCMDQTEVTVAAYTRCVGAGQCKDDQMRGAGAGGGTPPAEPECNYGAQGRDEHPVNCVDWIQADAYCTAQGKRLPTEEQWEYAARGGDEQRLYPWPDKTSSDLCFNHPGTCPVGSYPSSDSRWGVHDMAGNVWEWTASVFCDYPLPSKRCQPKRRVIRGGGWNASDWSLVRGANRNAGKPSERGAGLGFRCVSGAG